MANFEVKTRIDYRDVSSLVLDCRQGAYEVDATNHISEWINSAGPDPVNGGQFGNLVQAASASRPLKGVANTVQFSGVEYMVGELAGSLGAASKNWTVAVDIDVNESQVATPQAVLGAKDNSLKIFRLNGATYGYETGAGFVAGSGDMTDGTNVLASDGTDVDWLVNNVADIAAGALNAFGFTAGASDAIYLGRSQAGGDGLISELRTVKIWSRVLSPKELDFIHATIGLTDTSAGVPAAPRASLELLDWNDDTFDNSLRQVKRVNPQIGLAHKFILATIPAGEERATVQFACEVEAEVRHDSRLGGDLFTLSFIEVPGTSFPAVTQDAGWSSVFDVSFQLPGHYTMLFERPNGGGVFVHIDVEKEV